MDEQEYFLPTPILSIVVPCFNEAQSLPETISRLSTVLNNMVSDKVVAEKSFFYFVDDGSSDSSWHLLESTRQAGNKYIYGARLSRNFGHQNALFAGLMRVKNRCDISVSIDADLQQDPLAMREFISRYKSGADIVFGVRRDRLADGIFKKFTAFLFYRLMRGLGVNLIPNHADYRLLSNRALNALGEHHEASIFLRAICAQLGYKSGIVYFDVVKRISGESKYSLAKMIKMAMDGVISFSVFPLRLISLLGLFIFSGSVLMWAYVLYQKIFVGNTFPGWASIILPIYFIGGIQILCLGVISEYIAQILNGVKRRPRFIVEEELS